MSGQRAPPRPNQSPHATYNPQDYASPATSAYSPQQYSPHIPSPPQQPREQFQPYNPAVYRDSSIANAANQLYGSASSGGYAPAPAGYSPYQHQYSPSAPLPPTPYQQQQPQQQQSQPQYQYQSQSSYSPRQSPAVNSQDTTGYRPRYSSYTSPYQSPPSSSAYFPEPPYPPQHGIPSPPQNLPAPPPPPQHRSPSPDFLRDGSPAYGSHGRSGSEGLNITSAFPRPPLNDSPSAATTTTLPHRGSVSRPLPGIPQNTETFFEEEGNLPNSKSDNDQLQQDLFDQVETALNFGLGPSSRNNSTGGQRPGSGTQGTYYDDYGDEDSDVEAAAGLEAMRKAEQQEHDALARQSTATASSTGVAATTDEQDFEDEDYGHVDMSALGGGFGFDMPFGATRPSQTLTTTQDLLQNGLNAHPSVSSRGTATSDLSGNTLHTDTQTSMTSTTTANTAASTRVDSSGFMPPRRQMSFDADDSAERQYLNNGDNYPIPETFYPPPHQPGPRPLPLPPIEVGQQVSNRDQPYLATQPGAQQYHGQPHANQNNLFVDPGALLPRSHSLGNHSNAPSATAPARAKTDAEERKRLTGVRSPPPSHNEASRYASTEDLDLPPLPAGRRLQPSKLQASQFERCREPWALSVVTSWLRSLAEGDTDLRRGAVEEALVNLFTFKVPTINIAMAESLSTLAVDEMLAVGSLVLEEEWLRFGPETPSGVLFQLTNKGCYSQIMHERATSGRCYSPHCQRTERKLDISEDQASENSAEWAVFWGITKEMIEQSGRDKKEVELQNNLHEIVSAEFKFLRDLNVLRTLYRDGLQRKKDVMSPKTVEHFITNVFGKLDALQKANEEHLLPQLKYAQKNQGPWVVGFADVFRDWIRKAKTAYIEYTANFPSAEFLVRQEDRKNLLFHTFLDEMRNHPSANRLDIWHYLKVPITKIQRYSLLLSTVFKNMKQESDEKTKLAMAISEIQEATRECNARLAEESKKVDLLDLQAKLQLRPEMKHVELNLTQWGRELIHMGELQRTGRGRFTWLDTNAILLDNYLVLAKATSDAKAAVYDVSKMPIPMDLLVLESADDDPIVKSTMKGIAVGTATTKATVAPDPRIIRQNTSLPGKPGSPLPGQALSPSHTMGSQPSMVTTTALEPSVTQENTLYPFRVRHLGKEVYTLFAATSGARKEWADKIIEAKTRHAASLFAQNAEPFRLRVIADTAFAYDQMVTPQKGVTIKGTPLHRAIEDVERKYTSAGRPAPVCRARVNCATTFKQPDGRQMTAIGTDYGLYLSEADNPRGWTRVSFPRVERTKIWAAANKTKAIPAMRVTQVAVLEEFGIVLLIADKSLIAYHLEVVCSGASGNSDAMKKAPQKLSGAKDVGFFATGRMKDRTLVFYEKRDGRSSVFKILEPVYKKSTPMAKTRHWGFRGQTDFFRDYDDFYIPTDCSGLDLFSNSLSVATARGFEILNLEKKTPWSVPDLKPAHVATIAARLHGQEPIAMFRLAADGSELLCVYESCAVYVNKFGDVSRSWVVDFEGRARNASLVAGYLVLFDSDFVEVRDALNGRLKQIVSGRDVRCLDASRGQSGIVPSGPSADRSVKFALQHPDMERSQIVVELVLNEARRA